MVASGFGLGPVELRVALLVGESEIGPLSLLNHCPKSLSKLIPVFSCGISPAIAPEFGLRPVELRVLVGDRYFTGPLMGSVELWVALLVES